MSRRGAAHGLADGGGYVLRRRPEGRGLGLSADHNRLPQPLRLGAVLSELVAGNSGTSDEQQRLTDLRGTLNED